MVLSNSEVSSTAPRATPEATARFAKRMIDRGRSSDSYRTLGDTGLVVSCVGFGGYRVHDRVEEHHLALTAAIEHGCNLVDTSTNYGDGASERLVGRVVGELPAARREEVVVVSKVGYVQGSALEEARQCSDAGVPVPDMVEYLDGCWHCIHPEWIDTQLNCSNERTGLDVIDVYMLHNPEYFLLHASGEPGFDRDAARQTFYARIRLAFERLETHVRNGRIRAYGVSSNTLAGAEDASDAVSLERLLEIAHAVGGAGHAFRVIQVPLNLLEAEVTRPGPSGQTLLTRARDAGVGVLTNRPLNALRRGVLLRLVDWDLSDDGKTPRQHVAAVARLEAEFTQGLARVMDLVNEDGTNQVFEVARELMAHTERIGDAVAWDDWVQNTLGEQISGVVSQIDEALSGPMKAAWQIWLERYIETLGAAIASLRVRCARRSQKRSTAVANALDPGLPALRIDEPLSRKAIATLAGIDGVTTVLVGMRELDYVEDVCSILDWPRFSVDPAVLARLSGGA